MNAYTVEVARGKRLPCTDLRDAQAKLDDYLRPPGQDPKGSSAWYRSLRSLKGAAIRDTGGAIVAYVSYNCRLWGPDGETPIPSEADGDRAALGLTTTATPRPGGAR